MLCGSMAWRWPFSRKRGQAKSRGWEESSTLRFRGKKEVNRVYLKKKKKKDGFQTEELTLRPRGVLEGLQR